MEQWKRELEAWAADTGLAVHMYHGTAQERRAASRGMLVKGGVMLINYDLVRNCIGALKTAGMASAAAMPKKRKRQQRRGVKDDDSPSEEEPMPAEGAGDQDRPWDVVFVDEGHQIKNPSCQSGKALRKLSSRSRFLLSGTPLQNKLSDLWALMDFVQPALLGNHSTFEEHFSEKIAKGSKRNASRFEVELKDNLARELKRLTTPHILRRLKSEVCTSSAKSVEEDGYAEPGKLPNKTDVVLWLNLTQAQQELYTLFLGSDLLRNISHSKCGIEALRGIALLKKLCNHPLLCLPQEEFNQWRSQTISPGGAGPAASSSQGPASGTQEGDDDSLTQTQPAPECQQAMPRLRALVPNSVQGAALLSCKLRVLSVLLQQLQKRGHRCLIFSQSTRMLDLIQACVLRVLGLKFLRIDGTIEAKDRDLKLQKFHAPESRYFCICLSCQVGGTGLTITGADRVILVDPAWNPSMDAQAIDRVHRIGQDKPVVVYRLIGAGAIEDQMFRLQIYKRGLTKTYLEQEQQVRFFSQKELKTLFEPPNQSTSTQSLMAAQIGPDALEHEELLNVVACDIGSTDDPQALPFWQSSDVLGFSDYSRLFSFLEQAKKEEDEKEKESLVQAKRKVDILKNEEYVKDQVVENKFRKFYRDESKENMSPQKAECSVADVAPLEDVQR
jgi:SNF2 family DNA or RNA helicase